MKHCPECNKNYADPTLSFCLEDGAPLIFGQAVDVNETAVLPVEATDETATRKFEPAPTKRRSDAYLATNRRSIIIGIPIILLAAATIGGYLYYQRGTSRQIDSIAVMPFTNVGSDPDSEYLSQGLTESLIYRLSQVQSLKVSPASSVLRYKGTQFDPIKLGKELDVNGIVVGRITQRGDNLVISAELVDVRNNKSLWGEQYDRKISDLLATQREIAREIAETLKIQVSGERGLTKNYTNSNEAYLLHLQGTFLADKRAKPELERAILSFRKAIQLDPNFALAYVGIADAYNAMAPYGYMIPKDSFAEARLAAKRALEIDPSLAEAHSAYGVVLAAYDWNWSEAEQEHKRAIELAPNREAPHFYYATGFLAFVGRNDEAITALRRALEIEPKSINSNARLGTVLGFSRQYDLALEQARKAFDLDRNFVGARTGLVEALARKGLYNEAIELGEETLILYPDHQQAVVGLGYVYAKAGRVNDARKILAKIKEDSKAQHVLSARVARIHIALRETDEAFAWLEKAYRDRDWFLPLAKSDSGYDEIRDDPRFADLLRRMGIAG
jgi:TolB-like protein/Flp pilus assembly protein TadD